MKTTRYPIAALLGALLCAAAPAGAADLAPGGESVEIVDAKGAVQTLSLTKPSTPATFDVEGPGTLKVHARQLVDKKNPLTRVPITVTVTIDGADAKTVKIQDKAQAGAQVKGQEGLNPTPAKVVEVKIPAGRHAVAVKVSSSAVKGSAMRFEYDGKAPAVAAAPALIPLVPLSPAKPAPPPTPPPPAAAVPATPPLVPIAKEEPKPAPAPAPAAVPAAAPALVPIAKKEEPKPAPAAAPPPAAAKPTKADTDRTLEALGLKPPTRRDPPPKAATAAVKKEAEPAGARKWNIVEFTPKVGVLFPLQMGNPAPVGGLNAYYYPLRVLGVGLEVEYYGYIRRFKVSSSLAGDQGLKYGVYALPVTLDLRYEPFRGKGYAPFVGAGGGLYNVRTETANDWGVATSRSGNAFGWKIFGGVNGKLGFGNLCFDLGYSSARITTDNADNIDAGGVVVTGGYQMGF